MLAVARARIANGRIPLLVRLLTVALLIGGLYGGLNNFNLLKFWPWEMPALAYRFLAGAAAAYFIGSIITLFRSRWLESEFLIATVVLYGLPLGWAVLFQLNKLNWEQIVSWGFVMLVTPALIISLTFLWLYRHRASTEEKQALTQSVRYYLLLLTALAGAVGLWVYLAPKSAGLVWPWAALNTWSELDSRLIASMLITIAGGALLVWWRNDRGVWLIFLLMFTAYCLVASLGLALHASVTPAFVIADIIYIGIFISLVLGGWALTALARRQTQVQAKGL